MEDLSLHILDIAENSIAAGARTITISIVEDATNDVLSLEIADDGRGMNAETARKASDPFYTTRTTRKIGMGLSLLHDAARAANGRMSIHSKPGSGTTIRASFQLSHIDRQPLGNMTETIMTLIANAADVDIHYAHSRNGKSVVFDSREARKQAGEIPLNSLEALRLIREYIDQEEHSLAQ